MFYATENIKDEVYQKTYIKDDEGNYLVYRTPEEWDCGDHEDYYFGDGVYMYPIDRHLDEAWFRLTRQRSKPAEDALINYCKEAEELLLDQMDEPITPEKYMAEVKGGWGLEHIPSKFITQEMCIIAYEKDFDNFYFIPSEYQTSEMWINVVTSIGYHLQFVPSKFITPEICMVAVKNEGTNIEFVPSKFITPEMWMAVINEQPWNFKLVPSKFITPEMWMEIVKYEADYIQDVPSEYQTSEMWMVAVKEGWSLEHIPSKFITPEICIMFAVKEYEEIL